MLKIIKFSALWCSPCKLLAPLWEKLSNEIKDVEFESVDIDENPEMASNYKIMSIPTLVFVKDGSEINRIVGLVKEDSIRKNIDLLKA